jgi:hypothetical protein
LTSARQHYPPARVAWSIWGLGALLYLIGFYQRVAPAVMTDRLMNEFAIGATELGNLSAFYFIRTWRCRSRPGSSPTVGGRAAC